MAEGGIILTPEAALERVRQQPPFRFVDKILLLEEAHAIGQYTWDPAHDFYSGHFPGNPVTPGVLLIECMAQCGVVPLAEYYYHRDYYNEVDRMTTLFTDTTVDFAGMVRPGETVTVESKLIFYRRRKLRVAAEMMVEDGSVVCSGELAGIGVLG